MKYEWKWNDINEVERKIVIETFRLKEDARDIALSHFKNDKFSCDYIKNNEPLMYD